MKYLLLIAAIAALGWFGFNRYLAKPSAPAETTTVVVPVAAAVKPTPPPPAATPSSKLSLIPAPTAKAQVTGSVLTPAAAAAPDANAPITIDLAQALGPDNRYYDSAVGLSVKLPDGWTVRDAIRWGEGHTQNTVFMKPDVDSSASPSMYYKAYNRQESASIAAAGAEALLREQAQKKEASRIDGFTDYRNVPESFSFFDVNGRPAMSYFATFTRGDQVMTEHFIRVLGPTGYTMFFTSGKFEDVKAIMPQLHQAASTVKGP